MATIITRAGKATALAASEYDDALKRETTTKSGSYTVVAADNRSTIEYTSTGTHTITLPDCSTIKSTEDTGDFEVTIKHGGTGSLTVDFAASDTVDGTDEALTLAPSEVITLKAGTGDDWMITSRCIPDGTLGYIMRMGAINPTWGVPIIQETVDNPSGEASSPFTSIPSWVTRIVVKVAVLKTDGSVVPRIQLGDSGGYEAADYVGTVITHTAAGNNAAALDTGFDMAVSWTSASVVQGMYTLELLNAATNLWVIDGGVGFSNTTAVSTTKGRKALSGTLTSVRVTMGGSDVFDASTLINISYS